MSNNEKPIKKLETDEPLSEKDEVKKAEHKVAKAQKAMEENAKSDPKARQK